MSLISPSSFPRGLLGCLKNISGSLRWASKKASGGGNKNPKQAPGNNKGIHRQDGTTAHPQDIIVHKQTKLWFHPGLNVRLGGRNNLIAMKTGTVRFTCEVPDLDWGHRAVIKYYSFRNKNIPFYKKYVHVIPPTQHQRFKCINTI